MHAIGLNYRDHAAEVGFAIPDSPTVFTKFVSSFTGPIGDIGLAGPTVDWEVELVAVIGERARNVAVEDGWSHIAGLTLGQDISERTVQLAGPAPQFSLGTSFPGFSPTGPWLVTPDELAERDDIQLGCSVNGESVQKGSSRDLVFSIAERRHPRLKVILPHAGGFLPYAADRVSAIAPLAPALASAAELLREFYFDVALSSGPSALPSLLGFADPARITYGSDYPYAPAEIAAGFGHSYERYPIDANLRGAIDRCNAEALFPRLTSVQS